MHSTDMRSIVAELLTTHGYAVHLNASLEGRSGAVYDVPVLAEGATTMLVEFKDSPDPVETADLDYLERLVDDAGADSAALVHQGPAPHRLTGHAAVNLWGPQTLRTMLGDVLLHEQTGTPLSPLPTGAASADPDDRPFQPLPPPMLNTPGDATEEVLEDGLPVSLPELGDDGLADLLPAAFQDPEDEEEDEMPMLDFDSLESLTSPVPKARASSGSSTEMSTSPGIGPSAIRPRIPVHEARAMVKDRISSIERETLTLWPVHIIDYECDLMVDGTLKQDTVHGRIQVRGDKQGTTEIDEDSLDVASIGTVQWDGAVDDHPFRREVETALLDAKHLVMESHTRMVDMEVEDEASDFTMMERKELAPDGDQIRLDHRAATYRPAWRFDSANGHVTIDALTGETIEESLRTRSGDTIIVD